MLDIEFRLSGDMESGLDKFEEKIREEVLLSGAAAMARVFYEEVKLNTSGARAPAGPKQLTGTLHDAVYRVFSKDNSDEDTKVYHVGVNMSKAPHWHLVEYGHANAVAHPYLRPAFDHAERAIAAGSSRMRERMAEGSDALAAGVDP